MKIHHIGYFVKNIDKAIEEFERIGFEKKSDIVLDDFRKIKICFIKKQDILIELVSSISNESDIYNLQKKYGNSPYHICYETEDIDLEVQALKKSKYIVVKEKHCAVALNNKNVCFLVSPTIGLIELVEE